MRTPPPTRTLVNVHRHWYQRASAMGWNVGVPARRHDAPPGKVTIMVSDEEIAEAIDRTMADMAEPEQGWDFYPADSREEMNVAAGLTLAALVPLAGHVPAAPTVDPPATVPDIPVNTSECEVERPELVAAAEAVAAEITRRIAESDFYAPAATAVDPEEVQQLLSNCVVYVRQGCGEPAEAATVRVEVHGVIVCQATRDGARNIEGEQLELVCDDDPEKFVNEVELVLAPRGCPSTLLRIRELAQLRAEPALAAGVGF